MEQNPSRHGPVLIPIGGAESTFEPGEIPGTQRQSENQILKAAIMQNQNARKTSHHWDHVAVVIQIVADLIDGRVVAASRLEKASRRQNLKTMRDFRIRWLIRPGDQK